MDEKRQGLYERLACENYIVEDVLGGHTAFAKRLDDIVAWLGQPDDEPDAPGTALDEFALYLDAVGALGDGNPLGAEAMHDITSWYVRNTRDIRAMIRRITAAGGAGSVASLGAGLCLRRRSPLVATLLQSAGAAGLTVTGVFAGWFGGKGKLYEMKAKGHIRPLYAIAQGLDAEVSELRQWYEEHPASGQDFSETL